MVTVPQVADVMLSKSVSNPTPNVGDTVIFTITVLNDGPDPATAVDVTDVLPAGYTYNAGSIAGGDSRNDGAAPTLTWTVNSLGLGFPNQVTLTFSATVLASPSDYVNVAQVADMDQYDPDSTPGNDDGDQSEDDEDNAAVVPQAADLSLLKTVSDDTPNVGDVVTFSLENSNAGPDAATGVAVADVVPAGFSNITNISNGGTLAGSTINWSGLTVATATPLVLTFDATVDTPTGAVGEYLNVAQVTASDQNDTDSIPGNDDGGQVRR